jgi:hypothetical protein
LIVARRISYVALVWALAGISLQVHAGGIAADSPASIAVAGSPSLRAQFGAEQPSPDARRVADWVLRSGDNQGMPFMIVDKKAARVFLFTTAGELLGESPVLLGSAKGDDSAPGIGDRKLSEIRANEKTTPAGRFVSSLGLNLQGKEILWVDYDAAISLHRVVTSNAKERRAQRLSTASSADNRISYGCINVPAPFFDTVVAPVFKLSSGVVYVLPEVKALGEVFAGV